MKTQTTTTTTHAATQANPTAKGKLFLGKLSRNCDKTGTRNCAAFLTWELSQGENGPEFSAQGEVWNHIKTDCIMAGQCVGELADLFKGSVRAQRIAAIWREWHLNGMNAGLPVQTEAIREWEAQGNRYEFSAVCAMLKERNLYEVPLPEGVVATGGFPADVVSGERGYHYGERWVYRPLPADVIAEILSWVPAAP